MSHSCVCVFMPSMLLLVLLLLLFIYILLPLFCCMSVYICMSVCSTCEMNLWFCFWLFYIIRFSVSLTGPSIFIRPYLFFELSLNSICCRRSSARFKRKRQNEKKIDDDDKNKQSKKENLPLLSLSCVLCGIGETMREAKKRESHVKNNHYADWKKRIANHNRNYFIQTKQCRIISPAEEVVSLQFYCRVNFLKYSTHFDNQLFAFQHKIISEWFSTILQYR